MKKHCAGKKREDSGFVSRSADFGFFQQLIRFSSDCDYKLICFDWDTVNGKEKILVGSILTEYYRSDTTCGSINYEKIIHRTVGGSL